jgi:brefeldin A-inhibited guanine nucleotide-exchange protein
MDAIHAHEITLPLSPSVDTPLPLLHSHDTSAAVDSHINDESQEGEPEPLEQNRKEEIDDLTNGDEQEENKAEEGEEIRLQSHLTDPNVLAPRADPQDQLVYRLEVNGSPEAVPEAQEATSSAPTPPSKIESLPDISRDASVYSQHAVEQQPPHIPNGHHGESSSALKPNSPVAGTHKRSLTISKGHTVSVVLISSALETIAASKEAKRSVPLRESTQKALEMIRSNQGGDRPREIFEPLRLACETRNEKLMIASLDCISKLISYSFFAESDANLSHSMHSPPASPHHLGPGPTINGSQSSISQPSLVDLVAHTITSCHTETTPETVSLQIVKALLSLVLSPTILVHHSSLLKAVRTVYNVFLLSADPVNQMVAQGGLTQMVHHVFTRCRTKGTSLDLSSNGQESASPSTRVSFTISTPGTDTNTVGNGHHLQGDSNNHDLTSVSSPVASDESEPHEPHEIAEPQSRITLYVTLTNSQALLK